MFVLDSDANEAASRERENQIQAFTKKLAVPPVKSRRSNSADSDFSGLTTDGEARIHPSLVRTRSASTSMEDIMVSCGTKHDKATSTHDLMTWCGRRSRSNSKYDEETK